MADIQQLDNIEAKIRTLVEAELATGRPYLLSKLGKDLGADDLKVIKFAGVSLGDFVRNRLSDVYAIVLTGKYNNVQALVRAADGEENVISPRDEYSSAPAATGAKSPRYNYRFWAAFSVPLLSGRRFLNLQDMTFTDSDEPPTGDYREIEKGLVPEANILNRDATIVSNIEAWIHKNQLSADQFFHKPRTTFESSRHVLPSRSIMEAIIGALDRRQLASTSMPLDVVADLMRKRI